MPYTAYTEQENMLFAFRAAEELHIDFSTRARAEADKRFVLAAVLRERRASLPQIGAWLGRSPSTVTHMLRTYRELMAANAAFRAYDAGVRRRLLTLADDR